MKSKKKAYAFAPASVEQMAARREKRALEQREMLAHGEQSRCVVCINMNIAGPDKRGGLIDAAFLEAVGSFSICFFADLHGGKEALEDGGSGIELRFINENTGIEALIALDADAEKVKRICVEIEESHPAGRLFDMDVIAKNGEKLGRKAPRKCLICSENASVCARSRAHAVAELRQRTVELLSGFFSAQIGAWAHDALIAEVNITPKPGLVDRLNSGANSDMDADTFIASADALAPFFERMAELAIGYAGSEKNEAKSEKFFSKLRRLGVEAEKAMLAATAGVNTHRGAVYSLGLLMSAAAFNLACGIFPADESGLFGETGQECGLAENCVRTAAEFAIALGDSSLPTSNGAKMREKYGVSGPVQQAQEGFPLAMLAKSAKSEYYIRHGNEHEELAWAFALIRVMAVMDDNNALRRGGEAGAAFVKARAAELAAFAVDAEPKKFHDALLEFDEALIQRNISCGGAADMLAAALFLDEIEKLYAPLIALLLSSAE